MSIRDELAAVIRSKYEQHSVDRYPTEDALADWILARFGVVELPARTDDRWVDGDEGCEMSGWEVGPGPYYVAVWNQGEVQISYDGHVGEPVNPDYARTFAAALLAAANRAEASRVDR